MRQVTSSQGPDALLLHLLGERIENIRSLVISINGEATDQVSKIEIKSKDHGSWTFSIGVDGESISIAKEGIDDDEICYIGGGISKVIIQVSGDSGINLPECEIRNVEKYILYDEFIAGIRVEFSDSRCMDIINIGDNLGLFMDHSRFFEEEDSVVIRPLQVG